MGPPPSQGRCRQPGTFHARDPAHPQQSCHQAAVTAWCRWPHPRPARAPGAPPCPSPPATAWDRHSCPRCWPPGCGEGHLLSDHKLGGKQQFSAAARDLPPGRRMSFDQDAALGRPELSHVWSRPLADGDVASVWGGGCWAPVLGCPLPLLLRQDVQSHCCLGILNLEHTDHCDCPCR